MKEDFLHYVWKFQKFKAGDLTTTANEPLQIVHVGQHNLDAGPDFFNAKLHIGDQLWAGNVEIHIRSSHWYAHNHEIDAAYDSVILHVVWEHDAEVFRKDSTTLPTLVMQDIIAADGLARYYQLFSTTKRWIRCEELYPSVDSFVLENWMARLFLERLEYKNDALMRDLKASQNHWESLLFGSLSKSFGLKVNGDAFSSLAAALDYAVVSKCAHNPFDLESLLLGQSGLLDGDREGVYFNDLKQNYSFLRKKFGLDTTGVIRPKYFRLRPPNFPTIRLSQLAMLYTKRKQLFSEIIERNTLQEFYELFDIAASDYWETHYNFGVSSAKRKKNLSRKFVDLLLINTVLPIKFCYAQFVGKDISEELIGLASAIGKEENTIIKKFNELQPIATTAMHSQGLLQLKKTYCDMAKCLQCAVGNVVMSQKNIDPR